MTDLPVPTNPTPTVAPAEGALAMQREAAIRLLTDLADALAELGSSAQDDRRRLLEIAEDLRLMFFLAVVIGEFNSGKSSFVNALLGNALLPTGITPTTERIEVVRYGPEPGQQPVLKGDALREWTHPGTGAPGVALVDTPGVGSVFQRHEHTAKAFLHRSDLVIFVLSAKRALAETERLYLEMAQQYGKKIVLVINQVDLLTPQERVEVRRFVERQVEDLLGLKPLIFLVSARDALASGAGGPELGGVDAVRAYLRGLFSAAPPAQHKLLAQIATAHSLLGKHLAEARAHASAVRLDRERVRDVESELGQQAEGLNTQLRLARTAVDHIFESIRMRGLSFLAGNLSMRNIGRGVNREKLQREFQDVVIGRSLVEIQQATEQYVNALVDHSRLYWRGVIGRLNALHETLQSDVAGLDASTYAEQREALQEAIRTAETELRSYSSGRVLSEMETDFRSNMSGFAMSAFASVAGLIATIAAFAAPGPLIGGAVAAAPLALPALIVGAPVALVSGAFAWRYYRRISSGAREEFNHKVDALERAYDQALDDLTQRERARLTDYGHQVLTPIFSRLDVVAQRSAAQERRLTGVQAELEALRQSIEGERQT